MLLKTVQITSKHLILSLKIWIELTFVMRNTVIPKLCDLSKNCYVTCEVGPGIVLKGQNKAQKKERTNKSVYG